MLCEKIKFYIKYYNIFFFSLFSCGSINKLKNNITRNLLSNNITNSTYNCKRHINYYLGLDSSGSILDFNTTKQWAFKFIDFLKNDIENNYVKLGINKFSTNTHQYLEMKYNTYDTINKVIQNMPNDVGGFTNTPQLLNESIFAFNEHNNENNILILVTDGFPCMPQNCPINICNNIFNSNTFVDYKALLESKNIILYIIEIGPKELFSILDCIIPKQYRQERIQRVDTYKLDELKNIIPTLLESICNNFYFTLLPSDNPSTIPSFMPSNSPSTIPSFVPSNSPSTIPSFVPSNSPSTIPSFVPSNAPSTIPSFVPSNAPSTIPSFVPSNAPSTIPSFVPSNAPSTIPSFVPSNAPSTIPSLVPSNAPSTIPSFVPSNAPSTIPSLVPSNAPSTIPSLVPSNAPSTIPSLVPSNAPSTIPSLVPSNAPSTIPSFVPSNAPSTIPSFVPSNAPSTIPSFMPSHSPSTIPSNTPSLRPVYNNLTKCKNNINLYANLDSSSSFGKTNFKNIVVWVKELFSNINNKNNRLGINVFAANPNEILKLGYYETTFINYVINHNISYMGGFTNIENVLIDSINVLNIFPEQINIILLISDGVPCINNENCNIDLCHYKKILIDNSIRIILVRIGFDKQITLLDCLVQNTYDILASNTSAVNSLQNLSTKLYQILCIPHFYNINPSSNPSFFATEPNFVNTTTSPKDSNILTINTTLFNTTLNNINDSITILNNISSTNLSSLVISEQSINSNSSISNFLLYVIILGSLLLSFCFIFLSKYLCKQLISRQYNYNNIANIIELEKYT